MVARREPREDLRRRVPRGLSGREDALGWRHGLRQAPAAIRISRPLVRLLELALVSGAPFIRSLLTGLSGLKARLGRARGWFSYDQSPAQ